MNVIAQGINTLRREYKSGELKLLAWVVFVAVITVCTIATITNGVRDALELKTGEVLGGNKIVSSPYKLPQELTTLAKQNNIKVANKVEFTSMLINPVKENFALGSIKAVSSSYPLLGKLKVTDKMFTTEYDTINIPASGEVWVEPRLLLLLDLKVNQKVKIGEAELTIKKLITYEPDKIGIYSFTPRVLLNEKDLSLINVLNLGSRARYTLQLLGEKSDINLFETSIPDTYRNSLDIDTPKSARPTIRLALDKGESFLGLCAAINLILAGIAVAICARRFSLRHVKQVAVLRTIGASKKNIFIIYTITLSCLGLLMAFLGVIASLVLQYFYVGFLSKYLPNFVYKFDYLVIALGVLSALVLVLGFAMPRLVQLCNVSPVTILKKTTLLPSLDSYIVYLISGSIILAFMYILVNDINLLKMFFISLIGVGGALILLFSSALVQLKKISKNFGFNFRLGLKSFLHNNYNTIVQVCSISIILTVALVLYYIRTDLLNAWKSQLADNTPNYFSVNITKDNKPQLQQYFKDNNIEVSSFYPIVRGRLININNESVGSTEKRRGLHRPLNLTWSNTVPDDNIITEGKWFDNTANINEISVEETIVHRLNLKLNDTLTFKVGSEEITAKITSIREADWNNFKPNFYVIYKEGVLNKLPHTYINSFYMPPNKIEIVANLVKKFASINIIDTSVILTQVKNIINVITNVVVFLWLQTLFIGFILFFSVILSNIDERKKENRIMQYLGASYKQLTNLFLVEYVALGVSSAVLSILVANVVTYVLSTSIFNMQYKFNYLLNLNAFLIVVVVIIISGFMSVRNFNK